jgi:hypothetical protein
MGEAWGQVLSFAFFLWITKATRNHLSYPQKKGKTQDLTPFHFTFQGRSAGASSGMPRARHIRYNSKRVNSSDPSA